jgi:long-chain fatty acid transport protein
LTARRLQIFCAAFLVVTLFATEAFAAAFYLPGRGVRPLGRAGSYTVSGEHNLNSLWYNPANLGGMEELQLTIDLGLIYLDFKHTRAPRELENGETQTYDQVSNQAAPKPDPQVLIGGPLPVDGLTWAFGLYAPYLSGHTFPEDGAQRYVLVDNDPSLAGILHLALAYEISDRFRVGAGFQNAPASFVLINVASGYTGLFGRPEDPNLDILTKITLNDFFVPSANAGVWVKLTDFLQFGLAGQLPFVFKSENAKLTTRLPSHPNFQNAEVEGDTLSGSLKFPPVLRAGFRVNAGPVDAELSGDWQGWSVNKELAASPNEISVTGLPGIGELPVGPLTIPLNWKDSFSVRLGADLNIHERITPRFGYAFETTAIPDSSYSVFLADANKHALSTGGTFIISDSVTLDAGFAYYIMPKRTITDSQWRQINPTDDEGKVTLIVGNGEYRQAYIAGGLGVNVGF